MARFWQHFEKDYPGTRRPNPRISVPVGSIKILNTKISAPYPLSSLSLFHTNGKKRPTLLSNPLPGIPLIESPLFSIKSMDYGFSSEEERIASSLHENGYAVIDFPDADIDARIERIKANLAPRYQVDLSSPESDKTTGIRRIQDAWTFDEDVRAIASNSAILNLLGKLYGRRAFPFQTLNFLVGTEQDVHSDSVHFSSLPERFMCGVWLALEDIPAQAGPVFYLPGSHRWPIVTNALIGRRGYRSTLGSAQDPYSSAWKALQEAYGAQEETFWREKDRLLSGALICFMVAADRKTHTLPDGLK
jgi:hypothetical protein